ncbi:hypothetical protein SAMN04487972_101330 [Paracoccus halophilus]|uniref:Uncharacterized protein n=1 Tax=Paracoccus halophilus TaxID=376733 RepID=A0A099F4C4_9RHOB|nr:hypothetical protein [Paracoccus halophilus]KGJ04997.1 hypothetical protein IT41_08230 [Paracoccus halophilus]SFA39651.1 hypothetical protein SAMN04487972_101330 [Paracoccus halophilus]
MDQLEQIKAAFQRALAKDLLGIEQVDAVICDEGESVVLYGYTAHPDEVYIATLPLPAVHWRRACQ